jgi:hypothetical protein
VDFAHTRPQSGASGRVLAACGFERVGEGYGPRRRPRVALGAGRREASACIATSGHVPVRNLIGPTFSRGAMTLALTLTALHVLTAFVLVSVVGRGMALREAARAGDVRVVDALVGLAGRFEVMVRVPSIVVLLLGLLTAWHGGWPILGFLQGGSVNWILASLVLYGTLTPLIIWVFLPKGRIFARLLDHALAEGRVTPALTAAFADPLVAAAHAWELVVLIGLIVLMVMKPF